MPLEINHLPPAPLPSRTYQDFELDMINKAAESQMVYTLGKG
jgi:hypothetical protein